MIKQEADIDAGAVRQKPRFTKGAEIVQLEGQMHGTRHKEVAAQEGVDGHEALFVITGFVNWRPGRSGFIEHQEGSL